MNIQTEHQDNHTALVTVVLEPERVEKALRKAAQKLAKKGRIPGFRPGKAPFNIVLNLYGRQYVLGEAIEEIGDEVYHEILETSGVEPYGAGSLQDVKDEEDGVKLIFRIPERPVVELGNYRDVIRLPYEVKEVTDDMVTRAMENLREEQAVLEPVERPAKMGDRVTLSHIEASVVDSDEPSDEAPAETSAEEAAETSEEEQAEEEEDRVLIHQHDYERVLRDDDDDLFPGFSAQLDGMTEGEEKTFTLDIPADYDMEDIAGKTVRCEIIMGKVQARTLPEWTDELVGRISQDEVTNMLDLRVDVRKRLEESAKNIADQELAEKALDQLVEGATISYPKEVVDDYIEDMLADLDRNLRQQGLTLDDFMRITQQSREQVGEQYREAAARRARRALALGELVKREELSISEEELNAEIDSMSVAMGGGQSEQLKQFLTTDASRFNISNRMATDRAFQRLVAIAKGENPAVGPTPKPAADAASEPAAETEQTPAESQQSE